MDTFLTVSGIILLIAFLWAWVFWFPNKPTEFRIGVKTKGRLKFYQAQVKRPIFGWTGFWASQRSGRITREFGYDDSKFDANYYIKTYEDIKDL